VANEVLTESKDGVLIITINRPEARNAVNLAVAEGIAAAVDKLDNDADLRIGILRGAEGTFCAGMDLKAFLAGESPSIEGRGFAGLVEAPPSKPLIGALEGYVLAGGLELSLACDLTVAAESAMFGIPEVKRGLVAAGGGVVKMPRMMPRRFAMEMALTGDPVSAQRAYELGLVNRVVPDDTVMEETMKLANRIVENGPLAVAASKRCILDSEGWSPDELFQNQLPIIQPVFTSEDAKEGPRAFAEKRAPNWKGK
jgi:enoyl-CoA hydratase